MGRKLSFDFQLVILLMYNQFIRSYSFCELLEIQYFSKKK